MSERIYDFGNGCWIDLARVAACQSGSGIVEDGDWDAEITLDTGVKINMPIGCKRFIEAWRAWHVSTREKPMYPIGWATLSSAPLKSPT